MSIFPIAREIYDVLYSKNKLHFIIPYFDKFISDLINWILKEAYKNKTVEVNEFIKLFKNELNIFTDEYNIKSDIIK